MMLGGTGLELIDGDRTWTENSSERRGEMRGVMPKTRQDQMEIPTVLKFPRKKLQQSAVVQ